MFYDNFGLNLFVMDNSAEKPKIFIAASTSADDYATAVKGHLEKAFDVYVWSDIGSSNSKFLPENIRSLPFQYDFGVFIFSDDDILTKNNERLVITRDNVLFEFGVFVGNLGYERCYILAPNLPKFHLPSDLDGFLFHPFAKPENSSDYESVFRVPCGRIKESISKAWPAILNKKRLEELPERVAAICFRKNNDDLYEFLLVKSSGKDSDRRGFPKQPYRKNETRTPIEVAMEVAVKEGGVKVRTVEKAPKFLPFNYIKEDDNMEVNYTPFLLEVTAVIGSDEENQFRDPQFFPLGYVFSELRKNRNDLQSKKSLELVICRTYEFLLSE